MTEPAARQSRVHRRHRSVAQRLGDTWIGVVHAPGDNAIVGTVVGASAQEVMIRGMAVVDGLLKAPAGT